MISLSIVEKLIATKVSTEEIKWENYPFPHAIIDNFFPEDIFLKIVEWTKNINHFKDVKKSFGTNVELNKKVYGDKDLLEFSRLPIDILGGSLGKKMFKNFFSEKKLISMLDSVDYGGYYPFHTMGNGGILGSHVDHATSKNGDIHVANTIFYASPKWEKNWGGETVLFNSSGLKIVKKVDPIPNRVMMFIHSSASFHGVNSLKCSNDISRNTYYMDYYVKKKDLGDFKNNLINKGFTRPLYSFHSTTFLPLFPLGIKSFRFKFLIQRDTYTYIKIMLKYLVYKYFLNNKI